MKAEKPSNENPFMDELREANERLMKALASSEAKIETQRHVIKDITDQLHAADNLSVKKDKEIQELRKGMPDCDDCMVKENEIEMLIIGAKHMEDEIAKLKSENKRLTDLVHPSGRNLTILQLRQQIDRLKSALDIEKEWSRKLKSEKADKPEFFKGLRNIATVKNTEPPWNEKRSSNPKTLLTVSDVETILGVKYGFGWLSMATSTMIIEKVLELLKGDGK